MKHFCYFIEGRHFHVATDHKPRQHSSHQTHYLDYVAQFINDICHIKGATNMPADTLSRVKIGGVLASGMPSCLDCHVLAKAQREDTAQPDVLSTSLQLQEVPILASSTTLLCNVSTGCPRPYIPPDLQHLTLNVTSRHLSHPADCHFMLCISQYQCRCPQMGSVMHPVPPFKGAQTHHYTYGFLYPTRCSVQPCPY